MSLSYIDENEFEFHLFTTPFKDIADMLNATLAIITKRAMKEMKHKDKHTVMDKLYYEIQYMLGNTFVALITKDDDPKQVIDMLVREFGWDVNHPFRHPSDLFYGNMRNYEDEEPTLKMYQTTALEYACFMRNMELIQMLVLNYGANVTQDKFRLTEIAIYGPNVMLGEDSDYTEWIDIVDFLWANGAPKPRIQMVHTFVKTQQVNVEDLPADFKDALKIVCV